MSSGDSVCRACLIRDISINSHSLQNIQLKELYEKFTGIQVNADDRMPKQICSICYSRLQSCLKFSDVALNSERILRDLFNMGIEEVTLSTITKLYPGLKQEFSVTTAYSISTDEFVNYELKDILQPPPTMGLGITEFKIELFEDITEIDSMVKNEYDTADDVETDDDSQNLNFNEDEIVNGSKNNFSILDETSKAINSSFEYSCDMCNMTFKDKKFLDFHMTYHYDNKEFVFKNENCIKSFPSKDGMQLHMQSCFKSQCYICDTCSKSFAKRRSIVEHTKRCPRDLFVHKCKKCYKKFLTKRHLKKHSVNHSEKNTFSCEECKKSFSRKKYLNLHMSTHSEDKPFGCVGCKKSFSRKKYCNKHMTICREIKHKIPTFPCTFCALTFVDNRGRREHWKIKHLKDMNYKCDVCSTKFWNKKGLRDHNKIHIGEKRHVCDKCGKTYRKKSELSQHLIIHSEVKKYMCDVCGKKFKALYYLRAHIMRCHMRENSYACNKCSRSFRQQITLRQHCIKAHTEAKPFSCDRCSQSFAEEGRLTAHMKIHTAARPYACDVCEKSFREKRHLKSHMNVHTEERPNICEACGQTYKRRDQLNRHIKSKCKAHSISLITSKQLPTLAKTLNFISN